MRYIVHVRTVEHGCFDLIKYASTASEAFDAVTLEYEQRGLCVQSLSVRADDTCTYDPLDDAFDALEAELKV